MVWTQNEAPTGVAFTSQNQSVAAFVAADMNAFYHCAFYSTHNTLFDYRGRHFYHDCYIQGSIDFIFGRGRSLFQVSGQVIFSLLGKLVFMYRPWILQNCEIFVIADKRVKILGSITAQNRESAEEESGFVFVGGKVYGIGDVYLGRAKGPYSRVLFAHAYLSRTITPHGWTNWSYAGSTE